MNSLEPSKVAGDKTEQDDHLPVVESLLSLMASQRSRFVSKRALRQGTETVMRGGGSISEDKLAAGWQALFPSDRVVRLSSHGLKASQLPAWAKVDGQFVLVTTSEAEGKNYRVVDSKGASPFPQVARSFCSSRPLTANSVEKLLLISELASGADV